jgi:HSP20 family protein
MSTIVRWNPIRELVNLRNEMDRLFDDFAGQSLTERYQPTTWGLALDIAEDDKGFIVKASVPGVQPEDLDITVEDNILTIKGEAKSDETIDEGQYHVRERRYGSFSRSMTLPRTVKAEAIEAHYEHGVLTLAIPKAEEVQPKRISIKTNGQKVLEGNVS